MDFSSQFSESTRLAQKVGRKLTEARLLSTSSRSLFKVTGSSPVPGCQNTSLINGLHKPLSVGPLETMPHSEVAFGGKVAGVSAYIDGLGGVLESFQVSRGADQSNVPTVRRVR